VPGNARYLPAGPDSPGDAPQHQRLTRAD
jgi:hypothetical protein